MAFRLMVTLELLNSNEDELQDLLVDSKAFKKNFGHFVTEHYNPMQELVNELGSQSC